ncbi:protein phosphatase 2C domain-containing protein [Saccharopolyspora taberi]|uniref:Protein phosphatase 2C domain-containing protein n=2 Tax=Saccharopolyspora taberi TaxID=60895 RepID=A0ABN3V4C2_9PSEU
MQVTCATEAAPGAVNEDFVVAGPSWVVVLDGATAPAVVDSGCVHDVPWLVRNLAAGLATNLALRDEPLADVLASAIERVRAEHLGNCDLGNPSSPSSTVSMLRLRADVVEYLVLADSPVLLDVGGAVRAVVDDRLDHLPGYDVETVAACRNQPGGFWVASTDPDAAFEAVRGSVAVSEVPRAAVLSDGASRYVERFGLSDWAGLLDLLDSAGPGELLSRVRAAEVSAGQQRGKRHDDATAALIRF